MSEPKILVFDVETTGTDKQRDQVIELCMQFGLDDDAPNRTWRIKPLVEMNPRAQAVHGISAADLAECPTFVAVADEIREILENSEILVGYNLRFDIEMLQAEYKRLRQPPLDLASKPIVDPFRLWQQCEPRSLMDAHRRFVGSEFEAAHSASADVAATGRVLHGMLKSFGIGKDWSEIADKCEPERASWIGGTNQVRWDEDGKPVLSFGRHAHIPLSELSRGPDADYLRWVVSADFPEHVQLMCSKALELDEGDYLRWVEATHGLPKNAPPAAKPMAKVSSPPPESEAKSVVCDELPIQCTLF